MNVGFSSDCWCQYSQSTHLLRLEGSLQLGTKDLIPKLACDAEAQFVVEEMMGQMVLLELLVP